MLGGDGDEMLAGMEFGLLVCPVCYGWGANMSSMEPRGNDLVPKSLDLFCYP